LVWETLLVPLLGDLLKKHCTGDFGIDVHGFPEASTETVARVIYITLDGDTTTLEQTICAELAIIIPESFSVDLKFQRV
jgi:hypothetical protein